MVEKFSARLQSSYVRLRFLPLLFLESERESSRKRSAIPSCQHRTCRLPAPPLKAQRQSSWQISPGRRPVAPQLPGPRAAHTLHCEQHSLELGNSGAFGKYCCSLLQASLETSLLSFSDMHNSPRSKRKKKKAGGSLEKKKLIYTLPKSP